MLSLNIANSLRDGEPALDGWSIAKFINPGTDTLACRRLRNLTLNDLGLAGELPECLAQCTNLSTLNVCHNPIMGVLPNWLGDLCRLQQLWVNNTKLTGSIPEALGKCVELRAFACYDCALSGTVPAEALAKCTKLVIIRLGAADSRWCAKVAQSPAVIKYLDRYGIHYADKSGNKALSVSAEGKALLMSTLTKAKSFWWPEISQQTAQIKDAREK